MMFSVVINHSKIVQTYIEDMPVKKLQDFVIPSHVQDTDNLAAILNKLRNFHRENISAMNPVTGI